MKDNLTLAQLAEASGVPARTIRFYIARGLLNAPVKAGRGAAYTREHLSRLDQIKRLQSQGRTLSAIASTLGKVSGTLSPVEATAWWQHAIADDVIVWVKAGASPWRMNQLRAAVHEFGLRVQSLKNGTTKEDEDQ